MTRKQALQERDRRYRQHKKAGKSEQWLKSWLRGWRVAGEKMKR